MNKGYRHFDGGWIQKQYNYMSWALSCLQFRKYYDEVELYTDSIGKEIFVDLLGLPYTHVEVSLDELNPWHPDLWAFGKIYVYERMREPFIHADGDVYIWEALGEKLTQAPLMAQHLEVDFAFYDRLIKEIKEHFEYIPPCLRQDWDTQEVTHAYNSGIFGGQDVSFINDYARETRDFMERNKHLLDKVTVRDFAVFDQYYFCCYARYHGREVACKAHQVPPDFKGFDNFREAPRKVTYLHPLNIFKQRESNCELVAYRLRQDYPDYYYKIRHLTQNYLA